MPARRAIAGCLAAALLAACETAPIAAPSDASSPTRGLGMQLWYARTDTKQYEYFVVGEDGSLAFGGGMKAFDRETEWKGRLTDDEGARLRAIVDAAKWLDAADPTRKTAETPIAEFALRSGGSERKFAIQGPDEAVKQAVEVLSKASARRFDRYMQRLPDAGVQPRP
jgi:hypothetical protein